MTSLNSIVPVKLILVIIFTVVTVAGSDPNSKNSLVTNKISSSKVCSQDSPASCPTWSYCNNIKRW